MVACPILLEEHNDQKKTHLEKNSSVYMVDTRLKKLLAGSLIESKKLFLTQSLTIYLAMTSSYSTRVNFTWY